MQEIGKEAVDFCRLYPGRRGFKGGAKTLLKFESEYEDGAEAWFWKKAVNGFSLVDRDGRRIAYTIGSDSNNEIRVMENFLSDNSVNRRKPNWKPRKITVLCSLVKYIYNEDLSLMRNKERARHFNRHKNCCNLSRNIFKNGNFCFWRLSINRESGFFDFSAWFCQYSAVRDDKSNGKAMGTVFQCDARNGDTSLFQTFGQKKRFSIHGKSDVFPFFPRFL